jgi:hypothetical protein
MSVKALHNMRAGGEATMGFGQFISTPVDVSTGDAYRAWAIAVIVACTDVIVI